MNMTPTKQQPNKKNGFLSGTGDWKTVIDGRFTDGSLRVQLFTTEQEPCQSKVLRIESSTKKAETSATRKKIDYLYNKLDRICDGGFEEKNNQMSILTKEIDKQRMKLFEA